MFIEVKFGDGCIALCNINCKVRYLLMYLKECAGRTQFQGKLTLDLCDENGIIPYKPCQDEIMEFSMRTMMYDDFPKIYFYSGDIMMISHYKFRMSYENHDELG